MSGSEGMIERCGWDNALRPRMPPKLGRLERELLNLETNSLRQIGSAGWLDSLRLPDTRGLSANCVEEYGWQGPPVALEWLCFASRMAGSLDA